MQRRSLFESIALAAAMIVLPAAHAADQVVRLGTMSGPDAQIWEVVRTVAKRSGLDVKIIEFNDYAQPNAALDAGDHAACSRLRELLMLTDV